jgi:hypothetical protein
MVSTTKYALTYWYPGIRVGFLPLKREKKEKERERT